MNTPIGRRWSFSMSSVDPKHNVHLENVSRRKTIVKKIELWVRRGTTTT